MRSAERAASAGCGLRPGCGLPPTLPAGLPPAPLGALGPPGRFALACRIILRVAVPRACLCSTVACEISPTVTSAAFAPISSRGSSGEPVNEVQIPRARDPVARRPLARALARAEGILLAGA